MKKILLIIAFLATALLTYAQSDEVTLVVSGEGTTKTEATTMALRSAIEQAFGTFVSANTEILNDDIVRNEIATVSSGNIKSYKEISSIKTDEGFYVTVQSVVSIGKLIEYSKSHGSSAEFAGKTFAMQMKIEKLNIENEKEALHNMVRQLYLLLPNVFDYSIDVEEPQMISTEKCSVKVLVSINANDNTKRFYDIIKEHLQNMSIDENANVPNKYLIDFDGEQYYMRTKEWLGNISVMFQYGLKQRIYGFRIEDQNGKVIGYTVKEEDKHEDERKGEFYMHALGSYSFSPPIFKFTGYFNKEEYSPKKQHIIYNYKNSGYTNMAEDVLGPTIIKGNNFYKIWPFNSPYKNQTLYQISTQLIIPYSIVCELQELVIKPARYVKVEQPVMWPNWREMTEYVFSSCFFKQYGGQLKEYRDKTGITTNNYKAKCKLRIEADGTINLLKGSTVGVIDKKSFIDGDLHLYGGNVIPKATLDEYINLFNTCFMEYITQNKVIPYEVDGKPCVSYVNDWVIKF